MSRTFLPGRTEEEGIEDLSVQNVDQDLALIGGTWRRLFGNDSEMDQPHLLPRERQGVVRG